MIKTYSQAREFLESFIPKLETPYKTMELSRIRYFCSLLGNPQEKYPIVHVGGTSGKGSTATFAATILKEVGLKVGLHLSPHVQEVRERMQINAELIPSQRFTELVNRLTSIIRRIEVTDLGPPTYFELLVAMTFLYFAEVHIDAAVIEVGLGGTLDATNIIPPSLAILTSVSLDHITILGKTVTKIARDKMGIIKTGSPGVVSGIIQPLLRSMLEKQCHRLDVPLYLMHRDFELRPERPKLPGEFQRINFSLAVKAVEIFVETYYPNKVVLLKSAIKKAATSAFIPGRLETINHTPLIILDGAHNQAKMTALVNSLKALYPQQKWLVIMAVKQDKNYRGLLHQLDRIAHAYIFTTFSQKTDTGAYVSLAPHLLARTTRLPHRIESNSQKAVAKALKFSQSNQVPILITGSLYLAGEVRNIWYPIKT